jgi:hypothetical protein
VGRKSGRGPSGASNGVPGESATTMGMREEQRRRRDALRGGRERETTHEDEERTGEWKGESISEPPLLACRALMNANHDPEAARSTCCFPVQIAYNFYCHGRNSSLMEARLISVLVLRPSRVSCVLLPSPQLLHHHLSASPSPSASPSSMSLRAISHPLPRLSASHSPLSAVCDSDSPSHSRSFSINATGRYAGRIYEEYDGILPALYC